MWGGYYDKKYSIYGTTKSILYNMAGMELYVWRMGKGKWIICNSLLVLSAIYDSKEECTQKKISQRWLVPKQTVNMILKDFEKQGLVELSPMRTDKRRKTICFTPKGKEYAKTILSKLRKVEMNAIDEMGIERMKRFNEDAALFVKLLGKAEGKNNEI